MVLAGWLASSTLLTPCTYLLPLSLSHTEARTEHPLNSWGYNGIVLASLGRGSFCSGPIMKPHKRKGAVWMEWSGVKRVRFSFRCLALYLFHQNSNRLYFYVKPFPFYSFLNVSTHLAYLYTVLIIQYRYSFTVRPNSSYFLSFLPSCHPKRKSYLYNGQ